MSIKVFHHNDLDGYAAAAVANLYYKNKYNDIVIENTVMDYGKKFPIETIEWNDIVLILDYSIEVHEMIELHNKCKDIIWIDHHISAIEKYKGYEDVNDFIPGIRKVGLCGAALTYEYFYEYQVFSDNKFLKLVNDWDVWEQKYQESEYLNIALQNNLSIDVCLILLYDEKALDKYIRTGKTYVEYRDMWANTFMNKYGFEFVIYYGDKIFKGYAANLGNANSKFFGDKIDKYDLVCTFCSNGNNWNYSIYSNKEYIDCSKIAECFGRRWA